MQHDSEGRRDVNKFAIHFDMIALVGLRAEVSAGFTVDSDAARPRSIHRNAGAIRYPQRRGNGLGALSELNGLLQRFNVLNVRLRLRQAEDFPAVLPLAAFLKKLDALEAFQNVTLGCNGAGAF